MLFVVEPAEKGRNEQLQLGHRAEPPPNCSAKCSDTADFVTEWSPSRPLLSGATEGQLSLTPTAAATLTRVELTIL